MLNDNINQADSGEGDIAEVISSDESAIEKELPLTPAAEFYTSGLRVLEYAIYSASIRNEDPSTEPVTINPNTFGIKPPTPEYDDWFTYFIETFTETHPGFRDTEYDLDTVRSAVGNNIKRDLWNRFHMYGDVSVDLENKTITYTPVPLPTIPTE